MDSGYVEGMLNREARTRLGGGIAIPHGTTDTRSLIKETGVAVHHFPEGDELGRRQPCLRSNWYCSEIGEHLGILKQLTKVLAADSVEDKLKQAKSKAKIIAAGAAKFS
ncbi:PTS sugar transporter subunit IIA [Vibrio chagasii]|nr:PTS sugar transporter subunit IIA [Vibrio chagasii]